MNLQFAIITLIWAIAAASENHLVAHYSRALRMKERRQRRDTGNQYWNSNAGQFHNRQRFWPGQTSYLDVYIYAPSKHTVKTAGESVHFDCELTDGYSATWSRENGERFSPSTETKKLTNRNIYRIDMENLDASDSGKYVCAANTGNPDDRESVYLEVRGQRPLQPSPEDRPVPEPDSRYPYVDESARAEQERIEMHRQRLEQDERERQREKEERDRQQEQEERERQREQEERQREQEQRREEEQRYHQKEEEPVVEGEQWPDDAHQQEEERKRYEEEQSRTQQQYQTDQPGEIPEAEQDLYLTDDVEAQPENDVEPTYEQPDDAGVEVDHPYYHPDVQPPLLHTDSPFATDGVGDRAEEETETSFTASNGEAYSDYVYDYMMDE